MVVCVLCVFPPPAVRIDVGNGPQKWSSQPTGNATLEDRRVNLFNPENGIPPRFASDVVGRPGKRLVMRRPMMWLASRGCIDFERGGRWDSKQQLSIEC